MPIEALPQNEDMSRGNLWQMYKEEAPYSKKYNYPTKSLLNLQDKFILLIIITNSSGIKITDSNGTNH